MEKFLESVKKFLSTKTIAYYLAVGISFLALVFSIVYLSTYQGAIGNNADGMVPESVGYYMLAGAFVEIVLCVLPQYKFIHLIALVLFGLSLFKQVFLVPDFIAGLINNVEYNQGNAGMNIFYLVFQLVIMGLGVAVAFMNLYKDKEVEEAEFKNIKGAANIAKIGAGAAIILCAVLVSTLTVNSLKQTTVVADNGNNDKKDEKPKFNPITDEIKTLAESKAPANDPKDIVFAKEDEYDFNAADFTALEAGAATRENHYLVYLFEGAYSEGYQGQYNEYYTYLYLWDDGLYTGKSNSQTFKGYWYNDLDDDGTADCLNMVSNSEKYASIVSSKATGFYNYEAYVYMYPGWGDGRSIIVAGYMVYETIALAIDTTKTGLEFKVGDSFRTSSWQLNRILQNLKYGSVFNTPDGDDKTKTKWTIPSGLLVDDKFAQAGEFEIKASWGGLETSVSIKVSE